MRIWPRTLFGRNALLLASAIALGALVSGAAGLTFLLDAQVTRAVSVAAQLINTMSGTALILEEEDRDRLLIEMASNENLEILSGDARPMVPAIRANTLQLVYVERFKKQLKFQQDLEWFVDQNRVLWLRLRIGEEYFWVGARADTWLSPLDWFLLSLFVTIAVVTVFSLLGSRAISRPLAKLKAATDQLELDSDPQLPRVEGPIEVVALADSFRRMADRLKKAENVRSETLAALSHDLRTPLARLRLAVELMEGEAELKESANRQVHHIDALIGQFMDYARGTFGEEARRFDLGVAVADTAAQYRIGFDGPSSLEFVGHPNAVRRAVINLIENAEKYGKAPISVMLTGNGQGLVIEVRDQGEGFDPDDAREMVQSFKRGSIHSSVSGAGLGLAIVDQVASAHGGSITFVRLKPQGFAARLYLHPLESWAQDEAMQEQI